MDAISNYTCIPINNCINPIKGSQDNKYTQAFSEDYLEIIARQQYYIENYKYLSKEELTEFIDKMSKYYGVRSSDIKFVEMDTVGFKSLNREATERFTGFTIRGRKQGYGYLYYTNGNLKNIGIYKNDKLNGTEVKTYYDINECIVSFQGDMIDGVKHGVGKEFYKNGNAMYDGQFRNNEWNGEIVKIYHYEGGLEYEGQILRGMREGMGKSYHENGMLQYDGMWENDKPEGLDIVLYNQIGDVIYKGISENKY